MRKFYLQLFFFAIVFTSNAQWSTIPSGTANLLRSVHASTNGNKVWIAGNAATLLFSNNAGASWSAQTVGSITALNCVFFLNDDLIGWVTDFAGKVFKTTDGGINWVPQTTGVGTPILGVHFKNASVGLAVGYNGVILSTADGGSTWTPVASGTTENLSSVRMGSDANTAWVAGSFTSSNAVIIKLNFSLGNWIATEQLNHPGEGKVLSVYMVSNTNGWVFGAGSTEYHTTNGGATWSQQDLITPGMAGGTFSLFGFDDQAAVTVGQGGKIARTTNGGSLWTAMASPTVQDLYAVGFANNTTGYAVGTNGTIIKYSGAQLPITLTSFTASTHEKAVSLRWETSSEQDNNGFEVLRNSGTGKWETVGFVRSKGNSSTLQTYNFEDQPTGGNTFLYQLRQIDVNGKSSYTNVLQVKLELSKLGLTNYPNPFKEQTTINYSLPVAENVSVVVRDQSGNLLKTISKAKQAAGNYAISFYTGILPAGQYYCELSAGSSKRSIKLSIIK